MAEENPFAGPRKVDPFQDPSVRAATSPGVTADEYNPFEEKEEAPILPSQPEPEPPKPKKQEKKKEEKKKEKKEKSPKQSSPPKAEEPPSYTSAPSFGKDEVSSKKERELQEREAALREREQTLGQLQDRANNFPPLPKFCPIKPCCYVNLRTDIPQSERWKMILLTVLLVYYWVVLAYNLFCTIGGIAIGPKCSTSDDYGVEFGIALAYFIILIPGSLMCWWFPGYYAYKNNSSLAFLWYFFVLAVQAGGLVLNGLGVPKLGAAGLINGACFLNGQNIPAGSNSVPGSYKAFGAFYIICAFLWFIPIPAFVILIFLGWRYYRSKGLTMQGAAAEAAKGAASNKLVQQAAVGAAKTGLQAGVAAAAAGN